MNTQYSITIRWTIALMVMTPFLGCRAAVVPNKVSTVRGGPYRPVILVHGIMADAASLYYLRDYIVKAHPGTQIIDTELFSTGLSLVDMWTQVNVIGALVKNVSDSNPNGFHILGDSQGGILVRGILQKFNNLNVHTFISMSSPQNGQFGDNALKWFPGWAKEDLHFILYTPLGQKFSVGGYWRDPHHLHAYKAHNIYLPVLNNESTTHGHDSEQFKQNFLRIQRLVLIGGPDDGTITPYQSAFFGAYDENEQVVPVEQTDLYINDQFGLRTLVERNAVHVHNISGVRHVNWTNTCISINTQTGKQPTQCSIAPCFRTWINSSKRRASSTRWTYYTECNRILAGEHKNTNVITEDDWNWFKSMRAAPNNIFASIFV